MRGDPPIRKFCTAHNQQRMIVELNCKIHAESGKRTSNFAVNPEKIRNIVELLLLLNSRGFHYATFTGIAAIRALHFAGPISCTELSLIHILTLPTNREV